VKQDLGHAKVETRIKGLAYRKQDLGHAKVEYRFYASKK